MSPHVPKAKMVFWESTARLKAKFVKDEREEDEEVERRMMKMEEAQQERSRQQEAKAAAAAANAAAAKIKATAAFFENLRYREELKERVLNRSMRERSRSRQRKLGYGVPSGEARVANPKQ
jgi:hypothetical protein